MVMRRQGDFFYKITTNKSLLPSVSCPLAIELSSNGSEVNRLFSRFLKSHYMGKCKPQLEDITFMQVFYELGFLSFLSYWFTVNSCTGKQCHILVTLLE